MLNSIYRLDLNDITDIETEIEELGKYDGINDFFGKLREVEEKQMHHNLSLIVKDSEAKGEQLFDSKYNPVLAPSSYSPTEKAEFYIDQQKHLNDSFKELINWNNNSRNNNETRVVYANIMLIIQSYSKINKKIQEEDLQKFALKKTTDLYDKAIITYNKIVYDIVADSGLSTVEQNTRIANYNKEVIPNLLDTYNWIEKFRNMTVGGNVVNPYYSLYQSRVNAKANCEKNIQNLEKLFSSNDPNNDKIINQEKAQLSINYKLMNAFEQTLFKEFNDANTFKISDQIQTHNLHVKSILNEIISQYHRPANNNHSAANNGYTRY